MVRIFVVDMAKCVFLTVRRARSLPQRRGRHRLHAAGVEILAGSDMQSGVFPGPGLHRELRLLVEILIEVGQLIELEDEVAMGKGRRLATDRQIAEQQLVFIATA